MRRSAARRLAALALALVLALLLPRTAAAHPLGNFTINLYSRLELAAGGATITYVVDLAEIPTFQALSELGGAGLSDAAREAYLAKTAAELLPGLSLAIDGQPAPLTLASQRLEILPGQGGLSIMRVQLGLSAKLPELAAGQQATLAYADANYAAHQGWHEIVVRNGQGVDLVSSTAGAADLSNELRAYPEDMLAAPLDQRSATVTITPGAGGVLAAAAPGEVSRSDDAFAALLSTKDLSPLAILLALLAAAGLGAVHALSPGHGKTIVAAYLVGSRGTARHAAFLGLTVTVTHTIGVFALGLITLAASRYVLPEQLYPWLSLLSGLLVGAMGASLLRHRLLLLKRGPAVADHDHSDGWDHEHGPDTHVHVPPSGGKLSWSNLLALGVSGGLLPCPSALIVLLGAISLGRVGLGVSLIVAFSAGLAGVMTGIGLLMLYGARLTARLGGRFGGERAQGLRRGLRWAPLASAGVVTVIGLAMAARALVQAGVLG
ncbi:MAG TPA: hypothetical protein VGE07_09520 [Herpetosiphonaceae bacterium]